MFELSQEYGVNLTKLYKRNRIVVGQEPAVGERVKLKGGKVKASPKLRDPNEPEPLEEGPLVEEDLELLPELSTETQANDTIPIPEPEVVEPENLEPEIEETPVIVSETEEEPPVEEVSPEPDPIEEPMWPEEEEEEEENEPENKEEDPDTTPREVPVFHTVTTGDTLWNISQRYNTTVAQIKKLNNMVSDSIQLGIRLRVK